MKAKLKCLSEVIFDVFADMFFLFLEKSEEQQQPGKPDWHKIGVNIISDDPYRLIFLIGERTAGLMAENYLGLQAPEMVVDVLKESVNVVAGNYLNKLNDASRLGIPEYLGKVDGPDFSLSENFLCFLAEEESLYVFSEPSLK